MGARDHLIVQRYKCVLTNVYDLRAPTLDHLPHQFFAELCHFLPTMSTEHAYKCLLAEFGNLFKSVAWA